MRANDHPVIKRGSVRAIAIETLISDPNPVHWPIYTIEDMGNHAKQVEARVWAEVVREMVKAATRKCRTVDCTATTLTPGSLYCADCNGLTSYDDDDPIARASTPDPDALPCAFCLGGLAHYPECPVVTERR